MSHPRTVAFYLPQFHRIPENDAWWGEGFTEWTNVRRAEPLFVGHEHPRQPTELGYYDLTDVTVARAQSELARNHDIDAFCMYFYWFDDGQRLLEQPLNAWASDDSLLPFMVCWANEPWTRRWDGRAQDVLMPQSYGPQYVDALFEDLLPLLRASHYLTVDGSPALLVHRVRSIPNPRKFACRLRDLARSAGLPGLYLMAAELEPGMRPARYGFDALVEFPPVGKNVLRFALRRSVVDLKEDFSGRLLSYPRIAKYCEGRRSPRHYIRHPGVMPAWDNTARRGKDATIYVDSSPSRYGQWLTIARDKEDRRRGERGLVFINAWNEWAEGAYLEPDAGHGRGYLNETRRWPRPRLNRKRWRSGAQIRSLVLLSGSSALAFVRRVHNRLPSR